MSNIRIQDKTRILSTVGHSEGTPPDLKGKHPILLTVLLLLAVQFLPTIALLGGGIPPHGTMIAQVLFLVQKSQYS